MSQQLWVREMVSVMLRWNQYDLYYLAKRLCVSQSMLCRALQGRPVSQDCAYRITCYYLAYQISTPGPDHDA